MSRSAFGLQPLWCLLILLPALAGCGSRELKIDIAPTYGDINRIIVQPKCVRCHVSLSTYDGLMAIVHSNQADTSRFYQVVSEGEMPMQSPPLSTKEVTAIRDWINSGASSSP